MKIKKVLNNNVAIVKENNIEKIVMGSGIAFQKKKNDIINRNKIEKEFVMKDTKDYEKYKQLVSTLPSEHIKIAEEIISYAEVTLGVDLNDHIHIALTDHLSFALERLKSGYEIKNKLLHEIKMLYKEEYRIAEWAKRKVLTNLNIEIPDDEVGFIALHIHTAKMNHQSMQPVLDATTFVNDVIEMIEKQFSIQIREDSISYQRLLTHLKFAFQRIQNNDSFHEIDKDMLAIIKEKHKEAFACAQNISKLIKSDYGYDLPTSEQAYITLHIQRLLNK